MIKKLLVIFFIVSISTNSWSYSECVRPVKNIWTSLANARTVWIIFQDVGSAVFKSESQLTEGQMSRFVSFALSAQATGRNLIVRYPEDDLTCPPTGKARNDIEGFWVQGKKT